MPPASTPARERGTVLLMVIGVLAMLAILAVVYASIGQADRRTSTAYVRSVQVLDVSSQFGDYIADIIGKDTLATIKEAYPGVPARENRVTWTYPQIEFNDNVKSDPTGTEIKFTPVGRGYQPWLAPIEPTVIAPAAWTNPDRQYLDFRDWASISNVSPNGQFVNLANLRNNFFAEPGIGADSTGRDRMSVGLTLFENNTQGRPQPSANPTRVDGTPADLNIPWHWTAMQRHAARPAVNFLVNGMPPSDDRYLLNQWADADGDGIVDSRWFELNAQAGPLGEWSNPGIAQQDKTRYFAAVRIIDLSGMTNISTAMDLIKEPVAPTPPAGAAAAYPFGVTPADTDLLRLLTNSNASERYAAGYDDFQQPASTLDAGYYGQYNNEGAVPNAALVGRSAYAALQWCAAPERMNDADAKPDGTLPAYRAPSGFGVPSAISSDIRTKLYRAAQLDPGQLGASETSVYTPPSGPRVSGVRSRTPFGMAEELELHAFLGVNDPRERSRLEAVLDGRRNDASYGAIFPTYGPARSNRGLDVERDRRGIVAANGQQDNTSLAQQHLDLRHTITTYNASRPLTFLRPWSPIDPFDPNSITDAEVRVNLAPFLLPTGPIGRAHLNKLFNHACDALMPYRGPELWNYTQPRNQAVQYAGRAEFVYRAAAHWAVNIRDAVDNDNLADAGAPTCVTLRISRNAAPPAPQPPERVPLGPAGARQPQRRSPRGPRRRPSNPTWSTSTASRRSRSSSRPPATRSGWTSPTTPWSAPSRRAPTTSGATTGTPMAPAVRCPPTLPPITIKHEVEFRNADFLGEIVAFQLTNPFDRDILVTKAGASGPEIFYYVEYAGRYFPLAEIDSTSAAVAFQNIDLKLKARETRVFYATSPRKEFNFNARFEVGSTNITPARDMTNLLHDWVNAQFRDSAGVNPQNEAVHTTLFEPTTGALVDPRLEQNTDIEDGLMDLHGEYLSPPATLEQRRVVKLWRILRQNPPNEALPANNILANDLLADRLRDPAAVGTATLLQRLDSSTDNEVPDTIAGRTPDRPAFGQPAPDPNDNTGFTITMWGAIRRPTGSAMLLRGAMPPWCIEARSEDQDTSYPRANYNQNDDGPGGRGTGDDYGGAETQYRSLNDFLDDQVTGGGVKINSQIRKKAEDKSSHNIDSVARSRSIGLDGNFRTFAQQAIRIALAGKDGSGEERNAGLFKRVGDVLLPPRHRPLLRPQSRRRRRPHDPLRGPRPRHRLLLPGNRLPSPLVRRGRPLRPPSRHPCLLQARPGPLRHRQLCPLQRRRQQRHVQPQRRQSPGAPPRPGHPHRPQPPRQVPPRRPRRQGQGRYRQDQHQHHHPRLRLRHPLPHPGSHRRVDGQAHPRHPRAAL